MSHIAKTPGVHHVLFSKSVHVRCLLLSEADRLTEASRQTIYIRKYDVFRFAIFLNQIYYLYFSIPLELYPRIVQNTLVLH
jgi:hypothetical protein